MAIEKVVNTNEDAVKRGKLLTLSLLIALSIFIQTILKVNEGDVVRTILTALVYFGVSAVGLIWAFNFQVRFKSIPFLVQSALFVASEYLFVQLFFVQKFSRIYEGLLLLILIGIVFVGTYVSFLMSNVFNVNLYKNIPLVNVGRTTSYIISSFTLFFFLFSLLALQLPIYFLLPLVIVVSVFLSYIHLKNLGYEGILLTRKTLLVSFLVLFMFLGSFLSGVTHEVSVLGPVVGYFVGIGVANMKSTKANKNLELLMYISILIAITFIILRLNIFA
ncbi:hypothetical protein CVU76_03180 [Candidatus Dojkabacteria bacterium HGW-Dojkabacteria-1]|uniref:Uncharacterized protein n=1 Tax=Candidatus Dojkabacteria bacterium HGW-Dojkabacteria-1 TaxID=2013761 RepID=A0A2N2F4C1_9BACT|nr:MAG: hypothetical protein CVU76_03180 [Candidatus Dojkabacteria bacterium HGW-Dojkabacteria-1]